MIAALADSPVNDEFPNAKREQRCECVIVVVSATGLANGVSGIASRLVEIQPDLVTLSKWLLTELALRIVFCGR